MQGIAYCGGMVSHIVVDPSNPWSFPTIQQLNNGTKIPHVGLVIIPSIFHTESTLDALLSDIERYEQPYGIKMPMLVIWRKKMNQISAYAG